MAAKPVNKKLEDINTEETVMHDDVVGETITEPSAPERPPKAGKVIKVADKVKVVCMVTKRDSIWFNDEVVLPPMKEGDTYTVEKCKVEQLKHLKTIDGKKRFVLIDL